MMTSVDLGSNTFTELLCLIYNSYIHMADGKVELILKTIAQKMVGLKHPHQQGGDLVTSAKNSKRLGRRKKRFPKEKEAITEV